MNILMHWIFHKHNNSSHYFHTSVLSQCHGFVVKMRGGEGLKCGLIYNRDIEEVWDVSWLLSNGPPCFCSRSLISVYRSFFHCSNIPHHIFMKFLNFMKRFLHVDTHIPVLRLCSLMKLMLKWLRMLPWAFLGLYPNLKWLN